MMCSDASHETCHQCDGQKASFCSHQTIEHPVDSYSRYFLTNYPIFNMNFVIFATLNIGNCCMYSFFHLNCRGPSVDSYVSWWSPSLVPLMHDHCVFEDALLYTDLHLGHVTSISIGRKCNWTWNVLLFL